MGKRRRTHAYAVFQPELGWLSGDRIESDDEYDDAFTFVARWVKTREESTWFDTIDDALEACRAASLELGSVNVIPVPR